MESSENMTAFVRNYIEGLVNKCLKDVLEEHTGSSENGEAPEHVISRDDAIRKQSEICGLSSCDIGMYADGLARSCIRGGVDTVVNMKNILCTGIVCLDLITVCEKYPNEDTETLADDHIWARGGNASNTATVLAYLGAAVEFFGTLVNNRWLDFLVEDFKQNGVAIENCVHLDPAKHTAPVSTCIVCKDNGSRTALPVFKSVTELTAGQFAQLDLSKYSWVHFEGRPKNDILKMIEIIEKHNTDNDAKDHVTISVEIEQPHSLCPELLDLFPKADVVLMSKGYAMEEGHTTKEEAVSEMYTRCKPGAALICAWGEDGAAAISPGGVVSSATVTPGKIVDTLGAGDTFNASAIYALSHGASLAQTVTFACTVAGTKCGASGFTSVKGMQNKLQI